VEINEGVKWLTVCSWLSV